MMKIVLMSASTDLDQLRNALAQAHSLRVSVDDDGVKFKINGGTWSPPMGCIDPESEYAVETQKNSGNKPGDPCPTENCEGVARWIPISEGNRGSKIYRCTDCCDEIDAK